jgi:hypothetical protein
MVVKGNDPDRWQQLVNALDEKLQLNLLTKLEKCVAYHFEDDILFLEVATLEEEEHFKKDAVFQQLQLIAQDVLKVDKIKIKRSHSSFE